MSTKRLFVFAGTYQEAKVCVEGLKWDSEWTYISEVEVLKGHWQPDVIYTGSFMQREDRVAIEVALDERQARRVLHRVVERPCPKTGTRKFVYEGRST